MATAESLSKGFNMMRALSIQSHASSVSLIFFRQQNQRAEYVLNNYSPCNKITWAQQQNFGRSHANVYSPASRQLFKKMLMGLIFFNISSTQKLLKPSSYDSIPRFKRLSRPLILRIYELAQSQAEKSLLIMTKPQQSHPQTLVLHCYRPGINFLQLSINYQAFRTNNFIIMQRSNPVRNSLNQAPFALSVNCP